MLPKLSSEEPKAMKVAMKATKKKTAVVVEGAAGLMVAATAGKLPASVANNLKGKKEVAVPTNVTKGKRKAAPMKVGRARKVMKVVTKKPAEEEEDVEKKALPMKAMKLVAKNSAMKSMKGKAVPMKLKATRTKMAMKASLKKKEDAEESDEDDESQNVAPMKAAPMKMMKAKKVEKTDEKVEKTDEESDEDSESDEDEEDEKVAPMKAVKDEESDEESSEDESSDEDEEDGKAAPMKAMKGLPAMKAAKAEKEPKEADVVATRKKELSAMGKQDLKDLIVSKGLETGVKDEMIKTLLSQEADIRKEKLAQAAKVREVTSKIRAEFNSQKLDDLKELCVTKGLKAGGSKVDKVERLLAHAQEKGDVEKVLASKAREARKQDLISMDTDLLAKLCDRAQIDPLVKEVMVERILAHESVTGVPTSVASTKQNAPAKTVMKVMKKGSAMKLKATRAKMAMKAKKSK